MSDRNLFTGNPAMKLRRRNGRYATAEQAAMDRLRSRNEFLEHENEMLIRKIEVFQKLVTSRKITI